MQEFGGKLDKTRRERIEFYKENPTVTAEELKKEGDIAQETFSRIVEEEVERVEVLAKEANERIVGKQVEQEETEMCQICLEDILPIVSIEMQGKTSVYQQCCGKALCRDCGLQLGLREISDKYKGQTKKLRCISCNVERGDNNWLPHEAARAGKGYALLAVAEAYYDGSSGLKKNRKKAFKLFCKAAQAGSTTAQTRVARFYYVGDLNDKDLFDSYSLPKAKKWARKAADKGNQEAQMVLADIILKEESWSCDETYREEVYNLLSLAAFQGHHLGCLRLGEWYECYWTNSSDEEKVEKGILLSLYWSAKAVELARDNNHCLSQLVCHLVVAMAKWHDRPFFMLESYPGYSHIPLCAWLTRRIAKNQPRFEGQVDEYKYFQVIMSTTPWGFVCASCGSPYTEEFKVCSRCKVFNYCSKECQVKHWKAGHKTDCKGHWIESFFPHIRTPKPKILGYDY